MLGELLTLFVSSFLSKDKPSPPQGPLTAAQVTDTSLMLTWKEPLSDGGRPVLDYTVEKRDASKKAWLKVGTTESFSMEVPNLKPDNAYVLFCFAATD